MSLALFCMRVLESHRTNYDGTGKWQHKNVVNEKCNDG